MAFPVYLANKNATCTINSQTMAAKGGSVDEEIGEDEMTNLQTGGFYDEVLTIKKLTLSGIQIAYDSTNAPTFGVGGPYTFSISIPSGTTISGSMNIKKMSRPFLDPKGGYTFTLDGNSVGSYTVTG